MHCRSIHHIFLLISILYTFTSCTPKNQLISILKQDEAVFNVVKNPKYEVQILYTHVDLADTSFASHQIHVDASRYFYPASTVKLPVAILTLQKFNQLVGQGIDIGIEDDLLHGIDHPSQSPAFVDTTTQTKKPNAKRYIEKIFSISDNDAYNRLYEFLGQDYINQQLSDKKVIQHSVINHRVGVSGYDFEANQYTNPVRIFRDQKMMYDQLPAQAKPRIHNALNAIKGIGYFDQNDSLINKPFDFRYKNFYSIQDMESTLKRIIFPQKYKAEQQFELNEDDFVFLKKVMSDFPRSYSFYSHVPEYYDAYCKFLIFGGIDKKIPDHIKIYNKVGNAYGYLIDCAYIEDSHAKIGFFLTAVIHVNDNKIYNDGQYEYDSIGLPFLAQVGQMVYAFEVAHYGVHPK